MALVVYIPLQFRSGQLFLPHAQAENQHRTNLCVQLYNQSRGTWNEIRFALFFFYLAQTRRYIVFAIYPCESLFITIYEL